MTNIVRRAAGTPLSEEARAELKALAAMPDSEIDFSDIPERIYPSLPAESLPLENHTLTLRIDAEVASWLDSIQPEDARRVNEILRRTAKRSLSVPSVAPLQKAS